MNGVDRLFLDRAYELAERAIGNTAPNPPVGAVVAHDGAIVSEGYHHRAGEEHAEVHALRAAGELTRGATLYVSLEPCNHHGRTPPCTHAVAQAEIARVVIGTPDPNPRTDSGGIQYLRERGLDVEIADEPRARAIVEPFARAIRSDRPYVTLKMAASLDGFIASDSGVQEWLTGDEAREFVRELRTAHDGVVVGAGTIRVDNPQLTVRPPHHRLRDYVRIVACETDAVDSRSAVFQPHDGYARTIVLAPAGAKEKFERLAPVADLLYVGDDSQTQLDIPQAFRDLRSHGLTSVVCEGGPTMAGHLFSHGLVDRFVWLVAPRLLRTPTAVPVLTSGSLESVRGIRFDRVEHLGADLLISGTVGSV